MIVKGQFFESGTAPISINWDRLKSKDKQIVYPNYYLPQAQIVQGYMDTLKPYITYGLNPRIDNIPVVLNPLKAASNGLVVWAPKRMELYSTPPTNNIASPWIKHLTAHEYRHVVQLSNLNHGFTKFGGYIIGQAAVGIATLTVSEWFYEGDATLAETQLTEFGRGKQPEFSIGYRAMLNELDLEYLRYERLYLGSYNFSYPSIYELGYYMVQAGQTFYPKNMWPDMFRYCGRNPYLIVPGTIFLKREFDTSSQKIAAETFSKLKAFWHPLSQVENSSKFIPNSYTRYRHQRYPLMVDSTTILSLYYTLDKAQSFVFTNIDSGKRRRAESSVHINSRPILKDSTLYWTEYTPSTLWSGASHSVITSAKVLKGEDGYRLSSFKEYKCGDNDLYFITPINNAQFAYIAYNKLSQPSVVIADSNFKPVKTFKIEGWGSSVNGLAWDNVTDKLYLFIIENKGLSLWCLDYHNGKWQQLKSPSRVTQRDLVARDGILYFSSIASGKDEAHIYSISEGKEYQITTSKYGSFAPVPTLCDSTSLVATYMLNGYELALQKIKKRGLKEVISTRLPSDKAVPRWNKWDVINLDTLELTPQSADSTSYKILKRKPFVINPHTWLPLGVDINRLMSEYNFLDIKVGATVATQDLLGKLTATAGYGYVFHNRSNMFFGSIDYKELPVKFNISTLYGGSKQLVYTPREAIMNINQNSLKNNFSVSSTASLPLDFSDGRRFRTLVPYLSFSYYNGVMYDLYYDKYKQPYITKSKGIDKAGIGVNWNNLAYQGIRQIIAPYSYTISAAAAYSLANYNKFGKSLTIYGSTTLPGVGLNHIVQIQGLASYQALSNYNYTQSTLFPIGCKQYGAARQSYSTAINYIFPIAYPDGGIKNVLYFKRIAASAYFGYSAEQIRALGNYYWLKPYSYGLKAMADFNVLTYSSTFSIEFGLYKPSNNRGLAYDMGVSMAF